MSFILTTSIIIVSIIVIVLIVALFTKKNYALEREIVVNKSKAEVFDYIKFLRNQDNFNKWMLLDPAMKRNYSGIDGTVGFIYAWDGNKKAGEGEQEIVKIKEGERIDIAIRFVRPFAGLAYAPMVVESLTASQTKVKWAMSSKMKYPINIMLLFLDMDKMLGQDIDISLNTLKNILEK